MEVIKIREKSQITIPQKVTQLIGIKEGDYLEVSVEGNVIVLKPKAMVDMVALSSEGEKMLEEALDDVKKGRVKKFKNVDDLISSLKK